MDIKEKIGHRIRELRTLQNLTQEGLAWQAELDRTFMNHVENGRRNISVESLDKIVHALEISYSDFFSSPTFKNGKSKKK